MNCDAWLSAEAYAYLDDLSLAGLSWEFLRRNPDYQNDFVEAQKKEASCVAAAPDVDVCDRDWGLTFPCRSWADCAPTANLLAPRRRSADCAFGEGPAFGRNGGEIRAAELARPGDRTRQ
jgi:hypothetical protein